MKHHAREVARYRRSETGIAMPVAVIMVLLVGIVGAGMLTFVVADLEASGQVNRGQQAFGIADAGIAVAKKRVASVTDPTTDGWSSGVAVSLPGYSGSTNVRITNNPGGGYLVTSTGSTSGTTAKRKVQAVLQASGAGDIPTAPKNYYAGTNMTLNNYTEMVDGDILVEGKADITNTMKLTDGDVLVKGFGRFPNIKTIRNGNFYAGGGAEFSNTTTVENGSIYVDGNVSGNPNTFANDTTVTNGGIYVGDRATFSNNTKITGGDLYVEGDTRVGNLDVGSGGDVLIGGAFNVDNSLKLDNSDLYIRGNARIQNATITNSRIFITGTAEFVQTNNITNSEIYAGGYTNFTNSSTLTGTSLFVNGNINFSNTMTFGSATDSRYGNWRLMPNGSINEFNKTARANNLTAIGATGTISGNLSGLLKATSGVSNPRLYDNTTTPRFVATVTSPQPSNRIRFPFDPANPPGKPLFDSAATRLETAKADAIRRIEAGRLANSYLDGLKAKAIAQGNYREVASGTQELVVTPGQYRPEQRTWPTGSTYKTVVYYKYPSYSDSNRVQWLINVGCTDKSRKGILVIENGVFSSYGAGNGFNGTIVLRNGKFEVSGNYCMNGYVNSQTSFTSSNSSRFNLDDVPPLSELTDPSSASVVSWREVYE